MTQLESPFKEIQTESVTIKETDAMGREKFWENLPNEIKPLMDFNEKNI